MKAKKSTLFASYLAEVRAEDEFAPRFQSGSESVEEEVSSVDRRFQNVRPWMWILCNCFFFLSWAELGLSATEYKLGPSIKYAK